MSRFFFFFFSSRRRHTRFDCDWSSDVCSSDLRSGRYIGAAGQAFQGGGAPEVPLQPYDAVLILKQPDFELPRTVQLRGEVRFPGVYALRSKTDRLTDLLDRAGGGTRQAYPNRIRFFRQIGRAHV